MDNHSCKDKTLYGSEIIFDYFIEILNDNTLSESDIDSKSVSILKNLGWKEFTEIRQSKTGISEIDEHLKSKSVGSNEKGRADIYILIDDKLKVIIDNKNPKESIEKGIKDSIYYAECLLEMGYDIRIAVSYNGNKCVFRVYDSDLKEWVPFFVDGKEIIGFPSKELVELIYKYRINNIVTTEDFDSINIGTIIQGLKEIYRNIPHIQNDNQKALDFTISFIGLKSILEKHSLELGKSWDDLIKIAEQKKLKEEIKKYVEDIIETLESEYGEVFKIKEDPSGHIKAFDFLEIIKQFPNKIEKEEPGYLLQIFRKVNQLPHLHSSKFDLFGEVYQHLMDKHTRKIFGQYFTPRHLIKTLIRLFFENETNHLVGEIDGKKPINPKLICDPACGTGGFLTETFKYFSMELPEIDCKELAKKSIHGFDIYPANAVRSRINMYLAGDGFSRIDSLNTLREFKEKEFFDYIITNPPFGPGDYCVDDEIISNKRKEINFLIKVIELLKPTGKALIIVPDGILEAPSLCSIRKWVLRNCKIEKIIGLPKHSFAPYTHEKTYVLFLKKRAESINEKSNLDEIKTERIWMYIVDTDGYANSDKRFRTGNKDVDGKWLHDELSLWKDAKGASHVSILEENWKKKIQSDEKIYTNEWNNGIEGLKYSYIELNSIFQEEHPSFKSLNLLPERYLRPKKTETIEFEKFVEENKDITKDIQNNLSIIQKQLEGRG